MPATSETTEEGPEMTPQPAPVTPPARIELAGFVHSPLGTPVAGHPRIVTDGPRIPLHLGEDVTVIVADPAWLEELAEQIRIAQGRIRGLFERSTP
jgi:hypothetical protein